ncbi:MAG TPA: Gfo/Idh/MocA family oxidoreductase [Blastocatellia bacterium]|nr:Gfo/Idh/MocA family oxidoreductase [Blastocatellia bacterium]
MPKLRGAVIGCGMISEFHLGAWRRIPEVEIVALCDQSLERGAGRRAQFFPGARLYRDLAELLAAEELDFIDILTPPAAHREHCRRAQAAGLHIICQKPLGADLQDTRALAAMTRGYPRLFAVHENHRYRPWFREILRLAGEGIFGVARFLRLEHHQPGQPAEAFKLEGELGILLDYGIHLVDLVRALLGDPEQVYARLHRPNPRVRGESLAHIVYEYPRTTAVIDIAWKPAGLFRGGLLLEGDRGEALYEGTMIRGETSRLRVLDGEAVVLDESRSPDEDYAESFYLLQRECVDAMLGRGAVTQTLAENLKTLAATFAAYAAAQQGGAVRVADYAA